MQDLLDFLKKYEVWIYALLGSVILIYSRNLFLSFREWRTAIFGLEKENAQRRFSSALTVICLLMIVGGMVFLLVSFIAPNYPQEIAITTPTIDLLATPTVTLPASAAVPTNQGQVESAIMPTPPAGEGCIPGQVEWSFPKAGDDIGGVVELKGTINVNNLGFYKYEYGQPGSDLWTTIAAGDSVKVDEPLGGVWNTSQLTPGDYLLRLVVTDSQDQMMPACVIQIRIVTR